MNFPSFSFIRQEASNTFRRFPGAILTALIVAAGAIWLAELDYPERDSYGFLYNIMLVAILGIPLSIAIVVTVERWKPDRRTLWASQFLGLLLLTVYFFLLPEHIFDAPKEHLIRFTLFLIEAHLLVAVAPFFKKGEINGFWQYNKALFIRFLTAVLYTHVLYAGLVVALLSVDHLLGVDIEGRRYLQLWVLVFAMFNTWFFLAGVPDNLETLDQNMDYPTALKFFTQYILIPLVSIYVIILYLYAGKIILNWNWPEGWVANLILSFSVVGIFSLLLLYPIRNRAENIWIRRFSKGYYLVLLPLVVMLLLAIWRRVSEYGVTENRYFVLVAGIWLGGIALYFVASKQKNIKLIPVSLAVIVFLISFGPWGAIAVSENSQIQRLRATLTDHNILADGQISPAEQSVPPEDAKEISAGIRYLANVHGLGGIQSWFNRDLGSLADSSASANHAVPARNVVEMMGLEYIHAWETASSGYRYFSSAPEQPIRLNDFEWIIRNQQFNSSRDTSLVNIGAHTLIFQFQPDSMLLSISEKESGSPVITVNLQPRIDALIGASGIQPNDAIPAGEMIISRENESAGVRLLLQHINVKKRQNGWHLESLNMDVLLFFK